MNKSSITGIASRILLIAVWTVMALLLTVCAILVCTVKILKPEHLTPLIVRVANNALDAEVCLGRAELAFKPHFPVLRLQLDSLSIISHSFDNLAAEDRAALPCYADSLLVLDALSASLDLSRLSHGEIALRDVEIVRPGINIVLIDEDLSNFDIYNSTPDTTESQPAAIPAFSINRFSIVEPRAIRYFNAVDSSQATVLLLSNASIDGNEAPEYRMNINGHLHNPLARTFLQLDPSEFGMNGCIRWDPARPSMVAVEQFSMRWEFVDAVFDACVDFGDSLIIESAALRINPVSITNLLSLLPPEIKNHYRLDQANFNSNAEIALDARLTAPFSPACDSIPHAEVNISIAPARLNYGRARFNDLSLDITAILRGNNIDSATIDLQRFTVAGPATALDISGRFSRLISDPTFRCNISGNMETENLPPIVSELVNGSIRGRLNLELAAKGAASMFSRAQFHHLQVDGHIEGQNLQYLSADTGNMVTAHHALFNFDTHYIDTASHSEPSLTGRLRVDTADILLGDINLEIGGLKLGVGMQNNGRRSDTTAIVPVGGALKIASLKLLSITDSAGFRIRDLNGSIGLRSLDTDSRVPLISLDASMKRLSAGSKLARFMMRNSQLHASTYMHPRRAAVRREIRHLSDSISRLYPELSPDSVYRLAIERRRMRAGANRRQRVRAERSDDDSEVIDWGISKGLRRFLLDWSLDGTISTSRARLFTPYFPLRNRVSDLSISFSNDTIAIEGTRYKAGHSDIALQGLITDIRRALTGRRNNVLKMNFDITSDTIDVNELAAATFAGAAFAERIRRGERNNLLSDSDNEDDFDSIFDDVAEESDTLAPILVPANIDARIGVNAKNILYSDLLLTDLGGELLMYGGALNMNHLRAASDAGNLDISALYSAPRTSDIKFGLGLDLKGFKIERFLKLIPAIDSIIPMMRDFSGTIDADIAATVDIDSAMNMVLPSLDAAVYLSGDSLAFINPETYRTIGKWLRFRDRADNRIKHMNVQLMVRDNRMQIFPFTFNIDRYELGVVGSNDLAMNFDYHIAVLKSPLPFKFGVTVKGNPDKYKVRLGGARFKPGMAAESFDMVDTVRVNLIKQIQNVFRRGVEDSRLSRLQLGDMEHAAGVMLGADTLSTADSLMLVREGMIPDVAPDSAATTVSDNKKKRRRR